MKYFISSILAFIIGMAFSYISLTGYYAEREKGFYRLIESLQGDVKAETTMLGNPNFL